MKYLLDTNICIAFLRGQDSTIREKFLSHEPADLGLCSVVKAELLYGARKSQNVQKNLQKLEVFFDQFESLPFDDFAAAHYGIIRSQLSREGCPIGANDLLIASIALRDDLVMVTRNESEFRRVVGLRMEVW